MRRRAYNWVLILGCMALLTGLSSTARAGYITDATQVPDLCLVDSAQSGSSAATTDTERKPVTPEALLQMFGPLAVKGVMDAGSGVGTPSVSGTGSSMPIAGLLLPVEVSQNQLTARLAIASQTSRPPPHVDRLFRPPRVG
ncbi:hypothetical protein CA54_06690 [Symmachiella macrocystis]|uniref:Uncharacterized protein n=1 Tax=Symmachiella macrocystis TaxID=2527985 RepID=A0A5C6BJL4_9PLAN|nr:hypothetical protein [Symmachiella macrocystis]TWU11857.1 hypothetical protein CA54_06690 [Symmachiella macrocystis]